MRHKSSAILLGTALLLLTACGLKPDLADSPEDIVGSWQRRPQGWKYQFEEDGTCQSQLAGSRWDCHYRFEGTLLYLTEDFSICTNRGFATGTYEVELPADGGIIFVAVEDECEDRRHWMTAPEGKAWLPVTE